MNEDYDNLIKKLNEIKDKNSDPTEKVVVNLAERVDKLDEKIDTGFSSINEELKKKLDEELSYEVDEEKIVASVLSKVEIPEVKDGKDYILTQKDKKEIAKFIKVPVVKEIRTKTIVEQPIITNEIKEVAKYEEPDQIRDKLETLQGEGRLDKKAIKGLENFLEQDTLDRAIGILDQRTSFLINKINNLPPASNTSGGGTWGSITGTLSDQTDLQTALDDKLSTTLADTKLFIGNGSNVATAQTLSLSASGGSFALGNTGILTMPNAATSTRGLLTSTDWNTFNGKIDGTLTADFIPYGTDANTLATTIWAVPTIVTGISSAGSTQGTATALVGNNSIQVVTTVASGTGVKLPAAVAGARVKVVHRGAQALSVYPDSGDAIGEEPTNNRIFMMTSSMVEFFCVDGTTWYPSQIGMAFNKRMYNDNGTLVGTIENSAIFYDANGFQSFGAGTRQGYEPSVGIVNIDWSPGDGIKIPQRITQLYAIDTPITSPGVPIVAHTTSYTSVFGDFTDNSPALAGIWIARVSGYVTVMTGDATPDDLTVTVSFYDRTGLNTKTILTNADMSTAQNNYDFSYTFYHDFSNGTIDTAFVTATQGAEYEVYLNLELLDRISA